MVAGRRAGVTRTRVLVATVVFAFVVTALGGVVPLPSGPLKGGASATDPEDFAKCQTFLEAHRPDMDRDLSADYIKANIDLALQARDQLSYAKDITFDMFLNDVLPYAIVDENRDAWRPMFYKKFLPLVQGATTVSEAAQTINKEIWKFWNIVFKSDQTPAIMSPFQVIKAGHASCTGLSIFLVNACRSVGIPARMAGTPLWNNPAGGNHDWVEIYDPKIGQWSFTGAAEYSAAGFNRTWFFPSPAKDQVPGYTHGIFATSYAPTAKGTYFPMSWVPDQHWVAGEDVTQRYLDTPAGSQ